jgi:hypothetical protein
MMTRHTEAEIALARERYRPQRIKVLFVGESPPSNGKFFYCGGNDLLHHMRSAMGATPDGDADFLDGFKARGWFLDDLVMKPIDKLPRAERERQCRDARSDLAARIAEYQPRAIVSILPRIRDDVEIAACRAGSKACLYPVPFPGWGTQNLFKQEMVRILPQLLELTALP